MPRRHSLAIPIYSRVRVRTDRFQHDGASKGTIGYVIEVYEDGAYEVEVMDAAGRTVVLLVAIDDDLALADQMQK